MVGIMDIAKLKPGKVPGYEDLETLAAQRHEQVEEYLGRYMTDCGPIRTQQAYEAGHPLMDLQADRIAPLINYDHSLEMRTLSRRAYYAGVLIAQKLSPSIGWEEKLEVYRDLPNWEARKQILETTQDYMQPRPYLGKIIHYAEDKLDKRWKYRSALSTITTLVCMHSELHQYGQFIEEEEAKFAAEMSRL